MLNSSFGLTRYTHGDRGIISAQNSAMQLLGRFTRIDVLEGVTGRQASLICHFVSNFLGSRLVVSCPLTPC